MYPTNCSRPARYWDWALDFEELSRSPIFDPDHGFGGDGISGQPITSANGTCVGDGPFSSYHGLYVNSDYAPHCLSRTFGENFFVEDPADSPFRPEVVDELLATPDFVAFTDAIYKMHDDLHDGIGGDLQQNTSPYGMYFHLP
jgi:tyrosinase